jgi:hypothetical protein
MYGQIQEVKVQKYTRLNLLQIICTVLILAFVIYTMRDVRLTHAKVLSTFLFLGVVLTLFVYRPNIFVHLIFSKKYFLVSIFIIITSIQYIFSDNMYSFLTYVRYYIIIFSTMFISDFLLKVNSTKMLKVLFYGLILGIDFISFNLLIKLNEDPMLARRLAAAEVSDELAALGVGGGYEIVYAIALLIPFLIFLLKKNVFSRKISKVFIISSLILLFITVIKANYGMAFLFTAMGSASMLFFTKRTKKYFYTKLFAIIFILSIILIFRESLIIRLFDLILLFIDESSVLYLRINDFKDLLLYAKYSDNTEARFYFYKVSITTFMNNPLLGNLIYVLENNINPKAFFGNHSEWFDMLAKYGILGIIPMFMFLYNQVKHVYNTYNKLGCGIESVVPYIIYFMIGWLNFVNVFNVFVVIGLIIPISSVLFRENE